MVDIDGLFENYFRKFVTANAGKFTEDQLESKVGEIYSQFGKTKLKELGGKTPCEYYGEMSDVAIAEELKNEVESGVPVSDFLCEEIEKREGVFDELLKFVDDTGSDELATYAVNFLRYGKKVVDACPSFLELLVGGKCGDSLAETLTEVLCEHADTVAKRIVEVFDGAEAVQSYLVEILSNVSEGFDEVYEILVEQFSSHPKEIALYASYLSKYGDDRAVGVMNDAIKRGGLGYVDYKELKMAIEALGGEVVENRDYTADEVYKKLH